MVVIGSAVFPIWNGPVLAGPQGVIEILDAKVCLKAYPDTNPWHDVVPNWLQP
jgi:hypothetical protein